MQVCNEGQGPLGIKPRQRGQGQQEGLFKVRCSRKKIRRNVDLQLNEVDALVMEGAEKVKLLNAFFVCWVCPEEPHAPEAPEEARI